MRSSFHFNCRTTPAWLLRQSLRTWSDAELFAEAGSLVMAMEGFDGLLEGNGDEQADTDGGDMDEEVAPGVGGVFRGVDIEHKTECRG